MRTLLIASAGIALAGGGAADAQERVVTRGPGAGYGVPAMRAPAPVRPAPVIQSVPHRGGSLNGQRGARWGSKIGGRWWGGANAPGGWAGYRRPYRGWAVPGYWNAPRFFISDWSGYGLSQPPAGYNWTRYYDDAVLIDGRGSVYDSVGGLDWDRFDGPGGDVVVRGDGVDKGYDDYAVYARDDRRGPPPPPPLPPRRDTGLGGAAIGAVAGGVAGNVIAGRGNRLGGTLIGAGVGAAAGYAIDRAEDRGRRGPPPVAPDYGAGYPQPGYDGRDYRGPVRVHHNGGSWSSADGRTTVTTTGGGYYGGSTTTVVVQSAPTVTTTTTEYDDDRVSYSPRKVWKKRVWRRPRCKC